jgi:hypothetical protein
MTDPFDVVSRLSGGSPPPTPPTATSKPRADFDAADLFGDKKPNGGQDTRPPATPETSTGDDEDDGDKSDRLPEDEQDLSPEQLGKLWAIGEAYRRKWPALGAALLDCWPGHAALRQEILALANAWQLVLLHKLTAANWLGYLEAAIHRIRSLWVFPCTPGSHVPDRWPPEKSQVSAAWLQVEQQQRQQRLDAAAQQGRAEAAVTSPQARAAAPPSG